MSSSLHPEASPLEISGQVWNWRADDQFRLSFSFCTALVALHVQMHLTQSFHPPDLAFFELLTFKKLKPQASSVH